MNINRLFVFALFLILVSADMKSIQECIEKCENQSEYNPECTRQCIEVEEENFRQNEKNLPEEQSNLGNVDIEQLLKEQAHGNKSADQAYQEMMDQLAALRKREEEMQQRFNEKFSQLQNHNNQQNQGGSAGDAHNGNRRRRSLNEQGGDHNDDDLFIRPDLPLDHPMRDPLRLECRKIVRDSIRDCTKMGERDLQCIAEKFPEKCHGKECRISEILHLELPGC